MVKGNSVDVAVGVVVCVAATRFVSVTTRHVNETELICV